ncbi:MAG TPA: tripartite tricarboxylate transporter substrate binding protein [Ramlibacter sp.]|nr:tripartite tricarboxylate transporter substrate binding protein [Ramlibacter sp.]
MQSLISRRAVLGAVLGAAVPLARAQTYPNKPIHLLVGYVGGGMDVSARLLASRLAALLGQPVVVDNRPGASSMIAVDLASKAAPDGYTILLADNGALIANQLMKSAGDPFKRLAPLAGAFIQPLSIVVGNQLNARTPQELIALLKANPTRYNFATSGVSTVNHLAFRAMLAQMNIPALTHITYKGAAQIIPDVVSGEVSIGVMSAVASLPIVRGGRMRAVALMNTEKLSGAEDIPPLADAVPGFNVSSKQFVMAPAGTPAPILQRLSEALVTVLSSADIAQVAAQQGNIPWPIGPVELTADMGRETMRWAKVIKDNNIVIE